MAPFLNYYLFFYFLVCLGKRGLDLKIFMRQKAKEKDGNGDSCGCCGIFVNLYSNNHEIEYTKCSELWTAIFCSLTEKLKVQIKRQCQSRHVSH
jgi:hypothetical protein